MIIKVGDRFKGLSYGDTYRITAIGEANALYVNSTGDEFLAGMGFFLDTKSYVKIEPFFEKGKTYRLGRSDDDMLPWHHVVGIHTFDHRRYAVTERTDFGGSMGMSLLGELAFKGSEEVK